jgi:His/Glu/Gln/Arg/opine family amino acid ABC transporter permease subunit
MDFVAQILPYLLVGAMTTIELTILSMALALVAGLALALMRLSRSPLLRSLSGAYIEIIRGTPLLVQLFIIYYGLPQYGIRLEAFAAGVIGLSINYSAYLAEVYRAGILAIDKGQMGGGCSDRPLSRRLAAACNRPASRTNRAATCWQLFHFHAEGFGAGVDDLDCRADACSPTPCGHYVSRHGHLSRHGPDIFADELSLLRLDSIFRAPSLARPCLRRRTAQPCGCQGSTSGSASIWRLPGST